MDAPIEALKIEHSVISKELARFRPCHPETRCYFCREWAQFVYKKHVAFNSKAQDSVNEANAILKAGRYQLRLPDHPVKLSKAQLRIPLEELKAKLKQDEATIPAEDGLMDTIIEACNNWIAAPSNLTTLSPLFEPVQFDPFDEQLFEVDDPKEPSRLLDPLVVQRQQVLLPAKEFRLLKNLTGDILLSHKEPMCDHTRPEWKSPSDLDVERDIFNEKMSIEIKKALEKLEKALDAAWDPLNSFMNELKAIDKERVRLIGKGCQKEVDAFAEKQSITPFQDYWGSLAGTFKKKRPAVDLATVDAAFTDYFDKLVDHARDFQETFAIPRLDAVWKLLKKLWEIVMPVIRRMAGSMASLESKGTDHTESIRKLVGSVERLQATVDVQATVAKIKEETETRITEYADEIAWLRKSYKEEGKPSVTNRLDKVANNKAFKKQIKKAESGYYSIRQHFRYQLTQKIFPETVFAEFCLVCIEALMQEGELREALAIEVETGCFKEAQAEMVEERQYLFEDFEDGVFTGRRELAGILGRLFLKEGMRLQGENLAVQRQQTLLKSLGIEAVDEQQSEAQQKRQKQPVQPAKRKKGRTKNADGSNESQLVTDHLALLDKLCNSVPPAANGKADVKAKTPSPKAKSPEPSPSTTKSTPKATPAKATPAKAAPAKVAPAKTPEPAPVAKASVAKETTIPTKPLTPTPVKPATPSPVSSKTSTPASSKTSTPAPAKASTPVPAKASTPALAKTSTPVPAKAPTPVATKSAAPVKPVAPAPAPTKTTAVLTPTIVHSPSPPMQPKATPEPKQTPVPVATPEPKKATVEPAPQPAAQPDIGGWGSMNAAEMVKGWASLKEVNEEKKPVQPKANPQRLVDVDDDDGWGTPKKPDNSEASVWHSENTASWARAAEKKQVVDVMSLSNGSTPASDGQVTPSDNGWSKVAAKSSSDGWTTPSEDGQNKAVKKQQPASEGWNPSSDDGWNKPTPEAANDGWSKPQNQETANNGWAKPQKRETTNDGWAASQQQEVGGWGAPKEQATNDGWDTPKKQAVSDGWGSTQNGSASTGWDPAETQTASDGWGSTEQKKPNNSWNATESQATNDGWSATEQKATNDGWGVKQNDGWNASESGGQKKQTDGWASQDKRSSNGQWDNRQKAASNGSKWRKPENQQDDGGWRSSEANRSNESNWRKQQQKPVDKWSSAGNSGWGNSTGWNNQDEQNDIRQSYNVPDNSWDSEKQWKDTKPAAPAEQDGEVVNFTLKEILAQSTASVQPPGLPNSTAITTPLPAAPGMGAAPGLTAAPGMPSTPGLGTAPGMSTVSGMASALQATLSQQEPLPADQIRVMSQESLVTFVQTLQRDNARLLHALVAAQQEMSMQTTRYTDMMTLSRERENQMLQLFEARKQTDMEEARRYILSLEAKINTLEAKLEASSNGGNSGATAGFGNQDLFAGYREDLRNHRPKRYYNNRNPVIRCGNCGNTGHTSAQCADACRYCGSRDHLSEACMNQ